MAGSRVFWRLYAGYVALILAFAVIVSFFISRRVEDDSLSEIEDSLHAQAILLAEIARPALRDTTGLRLQERVMRMAAHTPTRLTVIRTDGLVIADSNTDPSLMELHHTRPEVLQARSQGIGKATRFSQTIGTRMMYFALPVFEADTLVGYSRISLPLTSIDQRISHLRGMVVLGAVLAAAIAMLLGFFMARQFTGPIRTITRAVQSLSEGTYGESISIRGSEEMVILARSFNNMAEQLRSRMEETQAEGRKLRAILSGMIEGVIAIDRDERVLHLNEAAGKMLGISPSDSVGKPVWEVTRVSAACEALTLALRELRHATSEVRLPGEQGDTVIELLAAPLRDSTGAATGAVLVLHDLTELKHLEAMRRDFVANVSHELKTPLTAILGLAETLLDDEEMDPETRRRFLRKLRDQSARLATLASDMLTLTRIESREGSLDLQPLDLKDLLYEAAGALTPRAEKKGLMVEVNLPPEPAPVLGDIVALRQVVDNLFDNAVKYTPEAGKIELRLVIRGKDVLLEVEDSGIGIEPKDQVRVFERFYRVDKARSREMGGTGLGLSIVKNIVLAHRGEISVESTPGRGSTFRVRLPLVASPSTSTGTD